MFDFTFSLTLRSPNHFLYRDDVNPYWISGSPFVSPSECKTYYFPSMYFCTHTHFWPRYL